MASSTKKTQKKGAAKASDPVVDEVDDEIKSVIPAKERIQAKKDEEPPAPDPKMEADARKNAEVVTPTPSGEAKTVKSDPDPAKTLSKEIASSTENNVQGVRSMQPINVQLPITSSSTPMIRLVKSPYGRHQIAVVDPSYQIGSFSDANQFADAVLAWFWSLMVSGKQVFKDVSAHSDKYVPIYRVQDAVGFSAEQLVDGMDERYTDAVLTTLRPMVAGRQIPLSVRDWMLAGSKIGSSFIALDTPARLKVFRRWQDYFRNQLFHSPDHMQSTLTTVLEQVRYIMEPLPEYRRPDLTYTPVWPLCNLHRYFATTSRIGQQKTIMDMIAKVSRLMVITEVSGDAAVTNLLRAMEARVGTFSELDRFVTDLTSSGASNCLLTVMSAWCMSEVTHLDIEVPFVQFNIGTIFTIDAARLGVIPRSLISESSYNAMQNYCYQFEFRSLINALTGLKLPELSHELRFNASPMATVLASLYQGAAGATQNTYLASSVFYHVMKTGGKLPDDPAAREIILNTRRRIIHDYVSAIAAWYLCWCDDGGWDAARDPIIPVAAIGAPGFAVVQNMPAALEADILASTSAMGKPGQANQFGAVVNNGGYDYAVRPNLRPAGLPVVNNWYSERHVYASNHGGSLGQLMCTTLTDDDATVPSLIYIRYQNFMQLLPDRGIFQDRSTRISKAYLALRKSLFERSTYLNAIPQMYNRFCRTLSLLPEALRQDATLPPSSATIPMNIGFSTIMSVPWSVDTSTSYLGKDIVPFLLDGFSMMNQWESVLPRYMTISQVRNRWVNYRIWFRRSKVWEFIFADVSHPLLNQITEQIKLSSPAAYIPANVIPANMMLDLTNIVGSVVELINSYGDFATGQLARWGFSEEVFVYSGLPSWVANNGDMRRLTTVADPALWVNAVNDRQFYNLIMRRQSQQLQNGRTRIRGIPFPVSLTDTFPSDNATHTDLVSAAEKRTLPPVPVYYRWSDDTRQSDPSDFALPRYLTVSEPVYVEMTPEAIAEWYESLTEVVGIARGMVTSYNYLEFFYNFQVVGRGAPFEIQ